MKVQLEFEKIKGTVKPLHSINNAPAVGSSDQLFHYLGDAGIPFSRLHDTGGMYGGGRYVDIANLFRNFDADPELPESYDFAFTDWLFEHITAQNTKLFFRLGASIENSHRIKAYYIYPPKDNLKWAKICEGIIRHYNEGWANGYHYDIQYWEIWNEPDNAPDIADNPCWKGTMAQFFDLYEIASNYLKEKFPHLKIGGYGGCGFYALTDRHEKSANSSARTDYFITFFKAFIDHITSKDHRSPLDFFSWHSYAPSEDNQVWAKYVRKYLDEHGLTATESILNEWNPGIQRRGTEEDACYLAHMLLSMHSMPVDQMHYYNGGINSARYSGLFNMITQDIFPAYYALHAFNELFALGREAEAKCDIPVLAATDGRVGKLLIANKSSEPLTLEPISAGWIATKLRINQGIQGLLDAPMEPFPTIPPMKFAIVEFHKG